MNIGRIVFDMTVDEKPTLNETNYLLKNWQKYTIYAKTGPYNRTDNPRDNLYSSGSVYLYNYVVVSDVWYNIFVSSSMYSATGSMGQHFELVRSYPRNHLYHKRPLFSLDQLITYGKTDGVVTKGIYKRCRQTTTTTVGEDGLEDGTTPVQSATVGNLNVIQSDNVINK